ncbi:pilus assembly protein PilM [Serratia sp. Se-PFBMAAmG]|nr:pilus assembly protein PilM [Serratia sp. Se-PFBMAAmG]
MLGRFGKDAGSLLGVEIAPDSVRIIQLQGRRGRHRVAACVSEPLGAGAASDDPGAIVSALRNALHRSGSRQRGAVLALPGSQVICKRCRLPSGLGPAQLEAQLLAEAERLFPFPLEDLALDFQGLGASVEQDGCQDVFVAACRQSALEPLEQLTAQAGLRLMAVEVDSIALQRIAPEFATGDQALLRLEASDATLHCWPREQPPQRHALALPAGSWDAVQPLPAAALAVVGSQVLAPARLELLSKAFGVPCQSLPPLPGLAEGDGGMALAYALALGGLR